MTKDKIDMLIRGIKENQKKNYACKMTWVKAIDIQH